MGMTRGTTRGTEGLMRGVTKVGTRGGGGCSSSGKPLQPPTT